MFSVKDAKLTSSVCKLNVLPEFRTGKVSGKYGQALYPVLMLKDESKSRGLKCTECAVPNSIDYMCRCRPAGVFSGILGIVQGIFFLKFGLLQGMLCENKMCNIGILCWLSCTFS